MPSHTQAVRNQDASKTAPVPPSQPEIPKPARKDETEKTVSLEASIGAPVKPPRSKSKKHPSPDTPKEKPPEVRKPREQPPAKDAKPEERPSERKPEDKPPVRQSIRPKRPAPPRPSHAPSIRKAGHSPSRVPPVGKEFDPAEMQKHRLQRLGVLREQLAGMEGEQTLLEEKGVELEQQLRSKGDLELNDSLMEEWFALVWQKNQLVTREADLVYELKDLELIEQHDELEKDIRKRLAKDDSLKTELERLEEEAMISELVELVEKRDELLWALHMEKTMEDAEVREVELMASTQGYSFRRRSTWSQASKPALPKTQRKRPELEATYPHPNS